MWTAVDVSAQQIDEVHPIKLGAAQNQEVLKFAFQEITQVLPDRVRCSLIPTRAFRRLLGRKNLNEVIREIIELVAGVDVPVQRSAVELGQYIDMPKSAV